jgi:DNA-binding transcriptional LysR family regulator
MDKLRALKYFLEVAETGSFSGAAKVLGVPASSVSRRIQDLEVQLGALLIQRSTRVVQLTELGALYFEQISPAVQALDYADNLIQQHSDIPSGVLKISAIPGYGRFCLEPALAKLRKRFPNIVVDVEMTDHVSNLAHNQIDIAIRATASLPDRAVARRLSNNQFLLVASPDYLVKNGIPKTVSDILKHQTLLYRAPSGILNWQANMQHGWKELHTQASFISNQGDTLINEAISGGGLALLPEWGIREPLADGRLMQVILENGQLSISRNDNGGIYLLYHRPKYSLKKVRASVDFLVAELSESP